MSAKPIRVALVGMGKIAHDQHLPAIAGNKDFLLAATVSRREVSAGGVPRFGDLADLLEREPVVDAVVLCTPPQVRYEAAAMALRHGFHVFLEKPPGATLAEVASLHALAQQSGRTLFASWHSRYAPGVEPAREWLAKRRVTKVSVSWREDVRVWHPGQAWIWEAGGLGVFDPGINALSILTHILPRPLYLTKARLAVPKNRAAPIAARMDLRDDAGVEIDVDLDFRQAGPQVWDIVIGTDGGTLKLSRGGSVLTLPTGTQELEEREYPGLYAHFARLVREGRSDVDVRPLQLVADAFLRGEREQVEAFYDVGE